MIWSDRFDPSSPLTWGPARPPLPPTSPVTSQLPAPGGRSLKRPHPHFEELVSLSNSLCSSKWDHDTILQKMFLFLKNQTVRGNPNVHQKQRLIELATCAGAAVVGTAIVRTAVTKIKSCSFCMAVTCFATKTCHTSSLDSCLRIIIFILQ